MKKLLLLLVGVPLLISAQENKAGFVLTGSVKGLAEKTPVFLVNVNSPTDTLSRTPAKAGAFTLKGTTSEPTIFELNFGITGKKIALFMGNDKLTVTGSLDDLKGIKVSGSPTNDDFVEFQKTFNPYFIKLTSLGQLSSSPEGAGKSDSISKAYAGVVADIQSNIDRFIQNKKTSFVSPFALVVVNQLSDDINLTEKRLNSLDPTVQNSFFAKYLKDQIATAKIGAVGTEEIDFTQNDTTGHPVTLSSFKGKYVLVDFWASWCHPCRLENPNVVAVYSKFRDKNFTILSVSLDRARDPWIKAINDDGLTWAHVSDLKFWSNEVALKYKIQSIPANMLIDPSGKIVAKNLRGHDLEAKLCELIGCN